MSDEAPIQRRRFLRAAFGRALRTASETVRSVGEGVHEVGEELGRRFEARERTEAPPRPHEARPPGALAESGFREACTRCGDCQPACPAQAIREDGEGYPMLRPQEHACAVCEDPLPCVEACPEAALMPLPRTAIRLGLARLAEALCLVPKGEACRSCETWCPFPGEALRMTEEGPRFVEASCTGCGLCAVTCPTQAILIAPL